MIKALRTFAKFGGNLREARRAAGLTQEQLAKRLRFKRTTPISLWERSGRLPAPHTVVKLAAALGCAPADLLKNVVTPYDALRGQSAPPDLGAALERPTKLGALQVRLLALAAAMPRRLLLRY